MKNRSVLIKIDSLIEALKDIQLTSNTVLNELEEIKQDLVLEQRTTDQGKWLVVTVSHGYVVTVSHGYVCLSDSNV